MSKKDKIYNNSYLIQGNFNYSYLITLLNLTNMCLNSIIMNEYSKISKDKKILNSFNNLNSFIISAVKLFSKISKDLESVDERVIISKVEYDNDKSKNNIKKNKNKNKNEVK